MAVFPDIPGQRVIQAEHTPERGRALWGVIPIRLHDLALGEANAPPNRLRARRGQQVGDDQGQSESVVSTAADGLDRRGADAPFGGRQLMEAADAEHGRIGAGRIRHRAVAHRVVHNDQCAATVKFEHAGEVIGYDALVGINED